MPEPTVVECLPCADGTAWVLCVDSDMRMTASRCEEGRFGEPISIGRADQGWSTAVDSTGCPWVAWSEFRDDACYVMVRKAEGAQWGPNLQVSTSSAAFPVIRADEYGNVWIFWAWEGRFTVCRMGARSGQEMQAAQLSEAADLLDAGTSGGALWLLVADGDTRYIVRGTEHARFAEPVRLPSL